MGQRLNIEIKSKDKIVANAYYHWSGYSLSAIQLTKTIVGEFDNVKEENEVFRAVALLQKTGAGLTREAVDYAYKNIPDFDLTVVEYNNVFGMYKFVLSSDRNNGLIEISEECMENTRRWEEARVTIDIDARTFDFDVYSTVSDEWAEDLEADDYIKIDEIPNYEIKFQDIPFDEVDKMLANIEEIEDKHKGYFKVNDVLYAMIY